MLHMEPLNTPSKTARSGLPRGRYQIETAEIDFANAGQEFEKAVKLAQASAGDFEVDLSRVTFIDCAGVHALVRLAQALPAESTLFIVGAVAHVAQVLSLLGVPTELNADIVSPRSIGREAKSEAPAYDSRHTEGEQNPMLGLTLQARWDSGLRS